MKIAVASDHAGFQLKQKVIESLIALGHEPVDLGTYSEERADFPDYAVKVAHEVTSGRVVYGVTVCMTGNGMNIAANKVHGIRAGLVFNPEMAMYTRSHNNANVLTLSSRYTDEASLESILKTFIETPFEGGRHIQRVQKITDIESADS
jgi:ribose 5-phosphate isomerase B